MTILWCGGEDIDFPNGYPVAAGNNYRAAFARTALGVYISTTELAQSLSFGAQTSAWLSFRTSTYPQAANLKYLGFSLLGSDKGLFIGTDTTAGKIALYTYATPTWAKLANESGASLTADGSKKVDVQVTSYGASATVKVYVNSVLVIDFTGDVTVSGMTNFNCVGIPYTGSANAGYCSSELIVADADTRLLSLKTLLPNGAGDTNDWTGSYTDIDEMSIDDIDAIYTSSDDDDFLANLTGMPAGAFRIAAVKSIVRAYDTTSSKGIAVGIKTNSVIHVGSTENIVDLWEHVEKIYNTNPETTNPFTTGEIDVLQLAIRSKAAV